jgi:hypothetical protein
LSLKTTELETLSLFYHLITRDFSTGFFKLGLDAVFSDRRSEIDPTISSQCTTVEDSEVYELKGQHSLVSGFYIATTQLARTTICSNEKTNIETRSHSAILCCSLEMRCHQLSGV